MYGIIPIFVLPILRNCGLYGMDITNLEIENKCGASTICFGNALSLIYKHLPKYRRIIVITDENVAGRYRTLLRHFEQIVIGTGEDNKNLQTAMTIYERLMEMGADTHTYLLGVGGGIVTDITGFVAATYMRGLDFSFVPTTLLAQVDASIGGKNGVNFHDYKNMVGTMRQPEFVICDVTMLHSLPEREFRAGMAEVIKSAILRDPNLFELLEGCDPDIQKGRVDVLFSVVLSAASVKNVVLAENEVEPGKRTLLNLGHTVAHAIEKLTHEVNHGEAVAIGLSAMSWVSGGRGKMKRAEAKRIDALLTKFGFNLDMPAGILEILREARYDKKKFDNKIDIVFPEAVGRCVVEQITFNEFESMFL